MQKGFNLKCKIRLEILNFLFSSFKFVICILCEIKLDNGTADGCRAESTPGENVQQSNI